MNKNIKRIIFGMLMIIGGVFFISGLAAVDEISVTGTINEDHQLVDSDNIIYDIDDYDIDDELVGKKVTIKGDVEEVEGTKTITVDELKVLED